MMNPENALVSRRVYPIGDGRVVVDEVWDLKHPDCPFVQSPFSNALLSNPGVRQTVMTDREYRELQLPLK